MKRISVLVMVCAVMALSMVASAKTAQILSGSLNINTATVDQFDMLPGIGKSKAQAIIEYRNTNKFAAVDDLSNVAGIGDKLMEKVRPYLAIAGDNTLKQSDAAPAVASAQKIVK